MATISPNDSAPAEAVHYTFATGAFDLGGRKKKYETDDTALISEALTHPWLTVEVAAVEPVVGAYVEQVRPEDDPMSRVNYHGNDPDRARQAEADKVDTEGALVAIQAGLEQTVPQMDGPIAQTLAADTESVTSDKVKG